MKKAKTTTNHRITTQTKSNSSKTTKSRKTIITSNDTIKAAYGQILKQTKLLLSTIKEEELRHIRIRKIKQPLKNIPSSLTS